MWCANGSAGLAVNGGIFGCLGGGWGSCSGALTPRLTRMKLFVALLLGGAAAGALPVAPLAAAPLESYFAAAPFPLAPVALPTFPERRFPVTDFGAVGDGQVSNTAAFARALAACAAAGGGHVDVPAGLWLTGPIVLPGNVDLHLARGALVQLTSNHAEYPMVEREGRGFYAAAGLSATGQRNLALTGEGIIDGAGESWRPVKREKTTEAEWRGLLARGGATSNGDTIWWPSPEARAGEDYLADLARRNPHPTADETLPARDFRRSPLLQLVGCDQVLIAGVTLRNSPGGLCTATRCTELTIRDATFFNEWSAQNGDGLNVGPARHVAIYHCTLSTGDDAICLKSAGRNPWPSGPGLEHVLVAECTVYHGHGGFVIGGSTEAGMAHLWATQCVFIGTDTGLRVKSGLGHGALVSDVYVDHIVMQGIAREAIVFDSFYDNAPASAATTPVALDRDAAKTPEFRDFFVSDVTCRGAGSALILRGLPQAPLHRLHFARLTLSAQRGFHATNAEDVDLRQVRIVTPESPAVTEKDTRDIRFTN